MADISKEILNFKTAVLGEEVRGSMISLAEKLNTEVENGTTGINLAVKNVNEVAKTASEAVDRANTAVNTAERDLENANFVMRNAENIVNESEAWAHGHKDFPQNDHDNAEYWSGVSREYVDQARNEADRAAQYASITAPDFYVDTEDMYLYIKAGVGIDFIVTEDNELCWRITA